VHSQELDRAAAAKKSAADAVEATKPKPKVRLWLTSPPSPDLATHRSIPSLTTTYRCLLTVPHYLRSNPFTLAPLPFYCRLCFQLCMAHGVRSATASETSWVLADIKVHPCPPFPPHSQSSQSFTVRFCFRR
jgi:hypothetical protein